MVDLQQPRPMAGRGSQLRQTESDRSIHERAENMICEGEGGGCRHWVMSLPYAQRRGTFECWDFNPNCSGIRDNPFVVYVATNRHSSPLFENHVAKPSLLGPSLRCLIGIIK